MSSSWGAQILSLQLKGSWNGGEAAGTEEESPWADGRDGLLREGGGDTLFPLTFLWPMVVTILTGDGLFTQKDNDDTLISKKVTSAYSANVKRKSWIWTKLLAYFFLIYNLKFCKPWLPHIEEKAKHHDRWSFSFLFFSFLRKMVLTL